MILGPTSTTERHKALLALVLLVPAPSIGVAMMLWISPGLIGNLATGMCKIWILAIPVIWLIYVDGQKPMIPRPDGTGIIPAVILGVIIAGIMIAAFYLFAKDWIDGKLVRERAGRVFIDTYLGYILLFSFLILLNSLLEEYVWRWFVFRKCEVLMGGSVAVPASAAMFTIHHVIAVSAWIPWYANVLASLGVFIGGSIWSALYLRYNSIWTAYVCHIFADVAVFIIGWNMIFGND